MRLSASSVQVAEKAGALEVGNVREVLEIGTVTPLPRTPDYVRGVINVTGSVIPVIDLRLKLGMGRTEESTDSRVMILDIARIFADCGNSGAGRG